MRDGGVREKARNARERVENSEKRIVVVEEEDKHAFYYPHIYSASKSSPVRSTKHFPALLGGSSPPL